MKKNLQLPLLLGYTRISQFLYPNSFGKYSGIVSFCNDSLANIFRIYENHGFNPDHLRAKMPDNVSFRLTQTNRKYFKVLKPDNYPILPEDVKQSHEYFADISCYIWGVDKKPSYHCLRQSKIRIYSIQEIKDRKFDVELLIQNQKAPEIKSGNPGHRYTDPIYQEEITEALRS